MTMASRKERLAVAKKKKPTKLKAETENLGASIEPISLRKFTSESLTIYGTYVVMNRAIPELRDGLKPVHRAVMWSMFELGIGPNAKAAKAARVVGDAMGKYHPHGDASIYDSMVGLANYNPRLVEGTGNWGTPDDGAAAMRYTEANYSHYANLFLLDKDYLKAVTLTDNFDNTLKIPLNLPALLPNMLLMGNPTAPAYGTRAGNPPMCMSGMVKLLYNAFKKGKPVTLKGCVKHLYVDYVFGCNNMYTDKEWIEYLKTGRGSLKFCPVIDAVWEHEEKDRAKKILIRSYSPGFRDNSIKKKLEAILNLDSVSNVLPACGENDDRAGKFGALYIIEPARGLDEDDFYELADKIEKLLTHSESYSPGAVIKNEKSAKFKVPSVVELINLWMVYRVKLEHKNIDILTADRQHKLEHQELLMYAIDRKDDILRVLKKVLESSKPDEALAKALKIDLSMAKRLLDLQLRRLAKLERPPIAKAIKDLKSELKILTKDKKDPTQRIAAHLKATYSKYCKLVKRDS